MTNRLLLMIKSDYSEYKTEVSTHDYTKSHII